MYRTDRLPGGSRIRYETTWENEVAGGIVNGGLAAAGWLVGSSISGLRGAARSYQDRKMQAAANAMDAAATAEEFDKLADLARDFTRRHPDQPLGFAYLSVALTGTGNPQDAIDAIDHAVELGFDEGEARTARVAAYEQAGDVRGQLQEWSALIENENPVFRDTALLCRARLLREVGALEQALHDVNRSISISPDELSYFVRGTIHAAGGELPEAIVDFTVSDRIRPWQATVLLARADVYERLGNSEAAQADRSAAAVSGDMAMAQEFLNYLRRHGVDLLLAPDGRDIEVGGGRLLRDETRAKLESLKPQLVRLLGEHRS